MTLGKKMFIDSEQILRPPSSTLGFVALLEEDVSPVNGQRVLLRLNQYTPAARLRLGIFWALPYAIFVGI